MFDTVRQFLELRTANQMQFPDVWQ
uniref:Uncharacterized protein n=1 Tax=Rhizophora mucronata TaxID=61149 RepID=A0A2P2QIU5_RHIMU